MFNTNFTCSRCGASVTKETSVCPKCHARLAGIKCKNCGFAGGTKDFVNDRCPKCRSVVNTGSTPAVKYCPKCKRKWDGLFCEKCGKTDWFFVVFYAFGAVLGTAVVIGAIVSIFTESPDMQSILCALAAFGAGAAYCWYRFIKFLNKRKEYKRIM